MQKSVEIIRPFIRNGAFPIDTTSLFSSYAKAVDYAHYDENAYAGQIITIADEDIRKTGVYIVDYDHTSNFNFSISPIEVSDSSGTKIFNFKGIVNTRDDIPSLSMPNDVYFVQDEGKFVIIVELEDGTLKLEVLNMEIDIALASRDNAGIISSDMYKAMSNDRSDAAVWYNNGDGNVENNTWIKLNNTTKEKLTNNFSVPSEGKVKALINEMTKAQSPYFNIIMNDENLSSPYVEANSSFTPSILLYYYPESAGKYKEINILDENGEQVEFEMTEYEFDNVEKRYLIEINFANPITSQKDAIMAFTITILYNESEDGSIPEGFITETLKYYFCSEVYYGFEHGSETEEFSDLYVPSDISSDDLEFSLSYNPAEYSDPIRKIYIKIPYGHPLRSVTYVPQNDIYAGDLFDYEGSWTNQDTDISYGIYSYTVESGFRSKGKYIFYVAATGT